MGQNDEHQTAAAQPVDQQDDSPVQDANGHDESADESSLPGNDPSDHTTGVAGDDRNERISDELINEEEKPICRICHCSSEDLENSSQADCTSVTVPKESSHNSFGKTDHSKFDMDDPFFLITPCFCTGTLQYVHHKCLQHWIRSSNRNYCELCKYTFKLKKKSKPIYKWECLNILTRKLVLQLLFNFITITFVMLSIYVIAERAAHQMVGQLDWRFWLKMLIVTIGFLCGILFIFFQLKLYISTIVRWKQYNQIIIIENVNSNQPMTLSTTIEMASNESK